jgi:hypothetical protein
MARPSTAARRYAESAFEIATRDKTIDDLLGLAAGLDQGGLPLGDAGLTVVARLLGVG